MTLSVSAISTMLLSVGVSVPWFTIPSLSKPNYYFDMAAGRYILLSFLRSSSDPASQTVLQAIAQHRPVFDGQSCRFYGVSVDPDDQHQARLQEHSPGIQFLLDFDQQVSRKYGVVTPDTPYHRCTYLLDERLRVLAVVPFEPDPDQHVPQLLALLAALPEIPPSRPATVQAPVLVVPRIFEPDLCQTLMQYYDQLGGQESGFMVEEEGRTLMVSDPTFKRRSDQMILDEDLKATALAQIRDRLIPEIHKAFQFYATRIERHVVVCYDSANQGFFSPHRDNTTRGTAHRRFAVSLNLNTGDYEGGDLRFPEFGRQTYSAPAGGAVVFSCSLLHEATPVTQGRRYAYLPFLYDDAAAQIRDQNRGLIGQEPQPTSKAPQAKGFQAKKGQSGKKKQ